MFDVPADTYDRFMGRYSRLLAPVLADFAEVNAGQSALDVGCGPGALLAELVTRLGPASVTGVDPSQPFVVAAAARHPGTSIQLAAAEDLPFPDGRFDRTLAQLVVHFMADPIAGLREMRRVTKAGGLVAACVWDFAGDGAPLSLFWRAARDLDPRVVDESRLPGAGVGALPALFEGAGLRDVEEAALEITFEHPDFEEWWEPYTWGVGPAGSYVASLADDSRDALKQRCRELLPDGSFVLGARAWAARGVA